MLNLTLLLSCPPAVTFTPTVVGAVGGNGTNTLIKVLNQPSVKTRAAKLPKLTSPRVAPKFLPCKLTVVLGWPELGEIGHKPGLIVPEIEKSRRTGPQSSPVVSTLY